MKTIFASLLALTSLTAVSALANHKGFHIECATASTQTGAIDGLHQAFHKLGSGMDLPQHGHVDVDSVGAITVVNAEGGQFTACSPITWVAGSEHQHP